MIPLDRIRWAASYAGSLGPIEIAFLNQLAEELLEVRGENERYLVALAEANTEIARLREDRGMTRDNGDA